MPPIAALGNFLKNKAIAIIVLMLLGTVYHCLPENHPVPFAELLYAVILVSSVTILGPFMRLLVFNEAAVFAEGGELDRILRYCKFTPALVHYWIATLVCYTTALVCVSALLSR